MSLAPPISGQTLDPIVVTAQRLRSADEAEARQVPAALRANPYVDDGHVTVTAKNGTVTLRGIVSDPWDAQAMKRIIRKMGVRKIVDDLELMQGGE